MMKATTFLEALLAQPGLPHADIQAVYDALPERNSLTDFRHALIDNQVMTYTQMMNIFIEKTLLPKSQTLLTRLEEKRKESSHFKPTRHKQKFCISEDDQMKKHLAFSSGEFSVEVPALEMDKLIFINSDEKQAVTLAMDLISMGELAEVEVILKETLESFEHSKAAEEVLSWLYLCTGHSEESEISAKIAIRNGLDDQEIIELLALTEQDLNKHLLAVSLYQKLLRLERVKSLWYLLIAYSQEQSNCRHEAAENYQIYSTIGQNPELKHFAEQHLRALRA